MFPTKIDPGRSDGWAYAVYTRHSSDRVAITVDSVQLTYRQWVLRSELLAGTLLARGLRRPAKVMVVLPNSIDFAIVLLACARVGLVLVPVSTWCSAAELSQIAQTSNPDLVIIGESVRRDETAVTLRDAIRRAGVAGPGCVIDWTVADERQALLDPDTAAGSAQALEHEIATAAEASADLAVLFTSGSTGLPKGVILTQGAVARNARHIAARMALTSGDRSFSNFPLFFSGGLCNALSAISSVGGELVTQSRFEAGSALHLIRERQCSARNIWHDGFASIAEQPDFLVEDLSRLRRGLLLDPELFASLGLPFDEGVDMYGMTETATAFTCGLHSDPAEIRQNGHGRPLPGNELRVCAPGSDVPCDDGVEGEICVRGPNMMRGYSDGSHHSLFDEDGYFHTGDLGRIDADGHLHFTGRLKSLIKVKGLSVQPEQVEATLVRHALVARAVVVARQPGPDSDGAVAGVVLVAGAVVEPAELRRFCASELSSYKVPEIRILGENELPETASGKVDRTRAGDLLRAKFAE